MSLSVFKIEMYGCWTKELCKVPKQLSWELFLNFSSFFKYHTNSNMYMFVCIHGYKLTHTHTTTHKRNLLCVYNLPKKVMMSADDRQLLAVVVVPDYDSKRLWMWNFQRHLSKFPHSLQQH